MPSRTVEILNSQRSLYVREFFCFDCGYYSLTDINKTSMVCPDCDAILEPNDDFIIISVQRIDQKEIFPNT